MSDIIAIWRRLEHTSSGKRQSPSTLKLLETDVQTSHGLVLAGMDASNDHRHLLVPISPASEPRSDEKSRGITVRERPLVTPDGSQEYFIDIECRLEGYEEIFTPIAEEMLHAIREAPEHPFDECTKVLDKWRHLLAAMQEGSRLSKPAIAGLITELHLYRTVLEQVHHPVEVWKGPSGSAHDFVFEDLEIEVKSTLRKDGWNFTINGLDQLAVPESRPLYLAAARLKEDDHGELNLPDLVEQVQRHPAVDTNELYDAVTQAGYLARDADYYRKVRFSIVAEKVYFVGKSFPRLTPNRLDDRLPDRVGGVKYQLDLTGLAQSEVAPSFTGFIEKMIAKEAL